MQNTKLLAGIAKDTLRGLSANPKYLLSKYFYDDTGSRIFQDIMNMPEYYLTDCEMDIFSMFKNPIAEAFHDGIDTFYLVEFGAGDGLKTKVLLQHLSEKQVQFNYIPIDISQMTNNALVDDLKSEIPGLHVNARTGDYFEIMGELNRLNGTRKIVLFLGANIGNYSLDETYAFLEQLASVTHPGDKVLIGFDLKKSPEIIYKAYNDPHGHTRRFNLNHLQRINRELGADFKLENFEHHTMYSPFTGMVKSYLVSTLDQTVHIDTLVKSFRFRKWEPIFMELSQKYNTDTILKLAINTGFEIERNFTDSKGYFVDSLWRRV